MVQISASIAIGIVPIQVQVAAYGHTSRTPWFATSNEELLDGIHSILPLISCDLYLCCHRVRKLVLELRAF